MLFQQFSHLVFAAFPRQIQRSRPCRFPVRDLLIHIGTIGDEMPHDFQSFFLLNISALLSRHLDRDSGKTHPVQWRCVDGFIGRVDVDTSLEMSIDLLNIPPKEGMMEGHLGQLPRSGC